MTTGKNHRAEIVAIGVLLSLASAVNPVGAVEKPFMPGPGATPAQRAEYDRNWKAYMEVNRAERERERTAKVKESREAAEQLRARQHQQHVEELARGQAQREESNRLARLEMDKQTQIKEARREQNDALTREAMAEKCERVRQRELDKLGERTRAGFKDRPKVDRPYELLLRSCGY